MRLNAGPKWNRSLLSKSPQHNLCRTILNVNSPVQDMKTCCYSIVVSKSQLRYTMSLHKSPEQFFFFFAYQIGFPSRSTKCKIIENKSICLPLASYILIMDFFFLKNIQWSELVENDRVWRTIKSVISFNNSVFIHFPFIYNIKSAPIQIYSNMCMCVFIMK